MKTFVENLIRKTKNPNFKLDTNLSNRMIIELLWRSFGMAVRGQIRFWWKPGCRILLGQRVKLSNKSDIKLGRSVRIEDDCLIAAIGTRGIEIGARSTIGAFSRVVVSSSYGNIGDRVKIGSNVGIGEFSYIGGAAGTEIGDDCIIGQYFSVHPENHGYEDPQELIRLQPVTRDSISIANNVWIGAKVTILDGAHVGHSSVIAAGSVVRSGKYPPHSLLAGVPARVVKRIETE